MILYIGAYLTVSYTCVYFTLKYIISIYKTIKHRVYQINTVQWFIKLYDLQNLTIVNKCKL